jgi:hypothetical protein
LTRYLTTLPLADSAGQFVAVNPEYVRCVRTFHDEKANVVVIDFDAQHSVRVIGRMADVAASLGFLVKDAPRRTAQGNDA